MPHTEKALSSREIFKGKVVHLRVDRVLLENGHEAEREVISHPGGVCVVPFDGPDHVLLVRQLRYPFGEELLEAPAGKLEPGEDHAACGMRELGEETGHTAGIYRYLGCLYPTAAYDNEVIHMYYAADLRRTAQRLDEDEFLDVVRLPFAEALEMVLDGRIRDGKTQLALLRIEALLRRGALPAPV